LLIFEYWVVKIPTSYNDTYALMPMPMHENWLQNTNSLKWLWRQTHGYKDHYKITHCS